MWQVKSGTIFDNVLIADDLEVARKFGEDVWKPTFVSVPLLIQNNFFCICLFDTVIRMMLQELLNSMNDRQLEFLVTDCFTEIYQIRTRGKCPKFILRIAGG